MADETSGNERREDERSTSATQPDGSDSTSTERNRTETDERGERTEPDPEQDRIPIDLSRSDDTDPESPTAGDLDAENEDDSYAPEPSSTPIEAGDPSLENVIFVALGAIAMILVLVRVVSILL